MSYSKHLKVGIFAWVMALSVGMAADPEPGLAVAAPESVGVSSRRLAEMSAQIRSAGHDIRSLVVLRRGKLILEWHAGGVTRDHNHNVYSVTKSVVATLTGIALADHAGRDANTTIGALLPDAANWKKDPRKAGISVGDLLTMRSGFPVARGNRPSGPERKLFDRIHQAPDRLRLILPLDLADAPGQRFRYNNIDPQLMAALLERLSGKRAKSFAEERLFRPLGFRNWEWVFPDKSGLAPGGYGIRLRAIDLAKLGQLYLDEGLWRDRRVVSADWTRTAVRDQTGSRYGYYWWTDLPFAGHPSYAAKGVRGQLLQVVPALDLVFVVLAHLPPSELNRILNELKSRHLAKAIASETALPSDPQGLRILQTEVKRAAKFIPPSRKGLPKFRQPRLPATPVR